MMMMMMMMMMMNSIHIMVELILFRSIIRSICHHHISIGTIFALYLGNVTVEHADFKTKLCKKVYVSYHKHTVPTAVTA